MNVISLSNYDSVLNAIIGTLICTQKGRAILNENNASLTKRERQFLLLLDAQDTVSKKMCVRMAPKIALQKMLDSGLIESKMGSTGFLNQLNQLKKFNSVTTNQQVNTVNSNWGHEDAIEATLERVDVVEAINSITTHIDSKLKSGQSTNTKNQANVGNKQKNQTHKLEHSLPSAYIQVAAEAYLS